MNIFSKRRQVWLIHYFMPSFQVMAAVAVGVGAAAAVANAAVNASNAADAKKANKQSLNAQEAQNMQNRQLAADTRAENQALYSQGMKDSTGYIQSASGQAQAYQQPYAQGGGAAFDKMNSLLGIGGYGSQAAADKANKQTRAQYNEQIKQYNARKNQQLAEYKKQEALYKDNQAKVKGIEEWYNSVGGMATGVSLDEVYRQAGVDPGAVQAPVWRDVGAEPTMGKMARYDPQYGSLNKEYGAEDYRKDPTYTPLSSNNLTLEDYKKDPGYVELVSNTFDQDEYSKDPGYTPMVNTLEDLQATPGYKIQLEQGLQALERSAAARGGLLSGASMKEANNYGQGEASKGFQSAWERGQKAFADAYARKQQRFAQGQQGFSNAYGRNTERYNQGQNAYGTAWNRDKLTKDTRFNRLSSLAGMGQNAVNNMTDTARWQGDQLVNSNQWGVGGMAGDNQTYNQNVQDLNSNMANTRGNYAQAQALANQQRNSSIGTSITDLAGQYSTYNRQPASGQSNPNTFVEGYKQWGT